MYYQIHSPVLSIVPALYPVTVASLIMSSIPSAEEGDMYFDNGKPPQKYLRSPDGSRQPSSSSSSCSGVGQSSPGAAVAISRASPPSPALGPSTPVPNLAEIPQGTPRAGMLLSTQSILPPLPPLSPVKNMRHLAGMQESLNAIQDEFVSVEIVFRSIQNAFTVMPLTRLSEEERMDNIDRELSIAYDDLMVQVRRLYRALNRLGIQMAGFSKLVAKDR